jgi:hypothetical protein
MKVFIGGSRRISKLNKKVTQILDKLIKREFTIIIGDANGADKAVQSYLADKRYQNVVVFCMRNSCRNNLGNWQIKNIDTDLKYNGFEFYALKDLAMVNETDYGFMLWDLKSKGTLNNIINLLKEKKTVVIYLSSEKTLSTLNELKDLQKILEKCDNGSILKFEKYFGISSSIFRSAQWSEDSFRHSNTAPIQVKEPKQGKLNF